MCADNQRLGSYTVKGLKKAPAGQPFDIRFTYDLNGILEVDTLVEGKISSLTIQKSPGQLSRSELKEAKKRMQTLKFHPRESLPNVAALNRAERVYVELRGNERAFLGELIVAFRHALETQEPEPIERLRHRLNDVTSGYR